MSTNTFFKKVLFDKRINDKIKKIKYKIVADIRESIVTRKYIRRCKSCFPIYGREERRFLKRLRQQIEDYVQNNEGLSYEQLEEATKRNPDLDYIGLKEEIGTPVEVLQSYYEEIEDREQLIKRISFIKGMKKIFIMLIVVITIFFMCRTWRLYNDYQEFKQSNTLYEEEIIEQY